MRHSLPLRLGQFLAELKRRRVFRVTAAYGLVIWLVIQVAATVLPAFDLPAWILQVVIVLAVLGFPIAVTLAWAFDIPEELPNNPRVAGKILSTRTRIRPLPAVLGVAVLSIGAGVAFVLPSRGESALVRERVAVAPFENRTGDAALDPLSRMLSDWITQGITQTGMAEVVSSTTLLLFDTSSVSPSGEDITRALARRTGAGTLITGAYYRVGDSTHVHAQIYDAIDGRVLRTLPVIGGDLTDPMPIVNSLRDRAMASLGTILDLRIRDWSAATGQPPTFEAYQAYLLGLESHIRQDYNRAVELFYQAAALDSTYTWPLLHAMNSLLILGRIAEVDSLVRTLDNSRGRMVPFERYLLDGMRALVRGDIAGLDHAWKRLLEYVPRTEWVVNPASIALHFNRPREALELLRSSDAERNGLRTWARYWWDLTESLHALQYHSEELEEALRFKLFSQDSPAALWLEARALTALGRIGEAEERAHQILTAPVDPYYSPTSLLYEIALEMFAHGYKPHAERVLGQALDWYSTLSPTEITPKHRAERARIFARLGRWGEAREELGRLATVIPKGTVESAEVQGLLAIAAVHLGYSAEARRIAADLSDWTISYDFGTMLAIQAEIATVLNDRDRAVALVAAATAKGGWRRLTLHTNPAFERLRGDPAIEALVRPKG